MVADASGAAAGNGFWNWDTLSSAVNVIGFAILAITVPVLQWFFKTQKGRREAKRKNEDERILDITKPFIKPLEDKIEKIDKSLTELNKTGESTNRMLAKMDQSFDSLKTTQIQMKSKVDYIDNFFQNMMKTTRTNPLDKDAKEDEEVFDQSNMKQQKRKK